MPGFEQYFRQLHVHNNTRNVWFREYWQQKFGCTLTDDDGDDAHRPTKYNRLCRTDNESLAKVPYNEDPKLAFVINSILAVVHGLDKMHKQVCNGSSGLCAEMARMDSSLLMQFLKSSRFTGITGKRRSPSKRSRTSVLLDQVKKCSSTRTAMVQEGMDYIDSGDFRENPCSIVDTTY